MDGESRRPLGNPRARVPRLPCLPMAGSVHDTYTKAVFSRRENANGLFKAVLPAGLLAALDLSSTEYRRGSWG